MPEKPATIRGNNILPYLMPARRAAALDPLSALREE